MRRLTHHLIGIDQGDVVMFTDFENGGPMWTGEGPRQARSYVHFSEAFAEAPAVRVGMTMWDISNASNIRADIQTEDVGREGFAIVFRTWGDTRVARVRVGWQAIGPLAGDEDWDVG